MKRNLKEQIMTKGEFAEYVSSLSSKTHEELQQVSKDNTKKVKHVTIDLGDGHTQKVMPVAGVAIITNENNEVLMGLSTANDFRNGKWSFVGGGIEKGETPEQAAEREAWEEAGIYVMAEGRVFVLKDRPSIVYVQCRHVGGEIKHNNEFSEMRWFSLESLPKETLERNKQILGVLFPGKTI
jgi:mutator protein MutT